MFCIVLQGVDHGSSNIDRSLEYIVTMLQVLASITALYSVTLKSCRRLSAFLSEQCHNFSGNPSLWPMLECVCSRVFWEWLISLLSLSPWTSCTPWIFSSSSLCGHGLFSKSFGTLLQIDYINSWKVLAQQTNYEILFFRFKRCCPCLFMMNLVLT